MLLITPDTLEPLEAKAIDLFGDRYASLWGSEARVVAWSHYTQNTIISEVGSDLIVLLGSGGNNELLNQTLQALNIEPPSQPEGYVLYVGQVDARLARTLQLAMPFVALVGTDARGVLYGLGHLLRKLAG